MKTEEYFGLGSIWGLENIANTFLVKRILLVTGKESFRASGAAELVEEILSSYEVRRFTAIANMPVLSDVVAGVEAYSETNPSLVVAVGGGSVIDLAKLIRIVSVQEASSSEIACGSGAIIERGIPLVAIPTTAGSGSEATHFAVVYIGQVKFSVAHEYIRPEVAIVDPQLTYSMPSYQTAVSGMDALSQAFESLWSVNSTSKSRQCAFEAADLILRNIRGAVHSPSADSREAMSQAAHLAGKAIDISKTTAPHALSYSLTASFGVPHGQAVALTVGSFLEFNWAVNKADLNDPRGVQYVKQALRDICSLLGAEDCKEGHEAITELLSCLGLETHLASFGITSLSDCAKIAGSVNVERLANNPRRVTRSQLERMLLDII